MAWECYNTLINIGLDLAIQDPILLQHFYMSLDRKTSKLLNTASESSFLHVSASLERSIIIKILENILEEVEEKPLEESKIAKPKSLPNPSPASAVSSPKPPKMEETPILDFMLEFEDELFDEYRNTSNYHVMRRP
jgi:hypothetical protein